MKVDIFIPAAPKDFIKLHYAIKSLIENIKEISDIHICTPFPINKLTLDYPIYYHLDKKFKKK